MGDDLQRQLRSGEWTSGDPRDLLHRADERLKRRGWSDEVKYVATALAGIDDAQRLAGKLDQNANSRAGEAARTLSNVLEAMRKR